MVEKEVAVLEEQAKLAKESGFTAVATELERKVMLGRKLAIAMEHFRYVKPENVAAFQAKLKAKTERPATAEEQNGSMWKAGYRVSTIMDQLVFHEMGAYAGLPPADVMEKVSAARALKTKDGVKVFDSYEVAEVQPVATHVKLPDPIVFGRIAGCDLRFFIADWGTDVKISDLIAKNEG